jgi:hypothetical protein
MKTYLSVVNPAVAALVLALCLWAAIHDDGKFKPEGNPWREAYRDTLWPRACFCSATLVLVGFWWGSGGKESRPGVERAEKQPPPILGPIAASALP